MDVLMDRFYNHYFIPALALMVGVAVLWLIYSNARYWIDLKRMTPEEREKFKEEERCDLQTW